METTKLSNVAAAIALVASGLIAFTTAAADSARPGEVVVFAGSQELRTQIENGVVVVPAANSAGIAKFEDLPKANRGRRAR